ncbi:MAG: response regulator [bacterium]
MSISQPAERGPVLVVDGDPAVRRVLRLVLEGAGFRCIACEAAEQALDLVLENRPKLVLVEVRLVGESGSQLARKLANGDGWRPRVALMSAYPRPGRDFEDFFLTKPIEFDRLLEILETIEHEPGW